ncbi:hypothetical protein [Gimesia sp.]|uniref:hypothetical protein n=1 Tax=Gimesia sp. TaxID=2024833 RepID=UPI000C61FD20|nr:hypothetical protein [Gimesia sp.]MAX39451.1 hypothetical protein [Gimesia sp.]HAH48415.1 hypothetical protein [Planctomycetaceae bacterium]HBL46232.1 hypothetical protein [Planctomycetaceae bacterium]|tara:strand:+ start:14137 stop:14481 length:345 start_codon:yes stop_codon:yes gene_type:complete
MKNTNPDTWQIPPDWHQDFEPEVSLELQTLREFAQAALKISSDMSAHLSPFEPGYLKVDLFHKQARLAEVYAKVEESGFVFSLYISIEDESEEEYHFRTVAEGVSILKNVLSSS